MNKKFLYKVMTCAICFGVLTAGAGCAKEREQSTKYEGDMLYNGFDSVADLYRLEQLYTWGFQPADGKLEIVGKDNFMPTVEVETGDYQAVIAQIDGLPELSAITFAHKDIVAQARHAYGTLSDEDRAKVTNLSKLEALENSDVLKGFYTVGDFGGDFESGLQGVKGWKGLSGNLVNAMSGTVIFKASNLAAADGALYVALFHDKSVNPDQAGDGIQMMFRADSTNAVLFDKSTGTSVKFNEGKSISPSETYTFYITYNVAEDYSKLTLSVVVKDSQGEEIVNASQDITEFNLTNFGAQTIKSWLCDHANAESHKTFYINVGNSAGVNIINEWTPTLPNDYQAAKDPHAQSDLSPRQGDGALRVYYEDGKFTDILARFDASLLSGLPVKEIGSFSVKVYNDSAEEKTVNLSLMKKENVKLEVEGGEFTLKPYAWTDCKVAIEPVLIDYFQEELIGLNISFKDVKESVYYLDDFRVQFGPVYTDEAKAWIAKVADLEEKIKQLSGKTITAEDKDFLETLCLAYSKLPQTYRYTVENASALEQAVTDYISVVSKQQIAAEGKETVLHFDSAISITQIGEVVGGSAAYTTEDKAPNTNGSMAVTFDGTAQWARVALSPSKKTEYEEIHVWVNNKSEHNRAFYLDWQLVSQAFDAEGNEIKLSGNYTLPANSGWIRLVYRAKFPLTQINVATLSPGGSAVSTVDTLLVGKVEFVYNFGGVEELISALPEYYEGYSDEDIAAVAAARSAYENLSIESQLQVSNLDKLVGLEANIWKSGFSGISVATPDQLTVYNQQDKEVVDALRLSYAELDLEVRKILTEEESLLRAFEEKLEQLQIAYVESVKTQISALDGTDKAAIAAARAAYDSLTEANKAKVDNASVLFGFEADIWTAMLAELPAEKDIIGYDANLTDKFSAIRTAYDALAEEVKLLVEEKITTLSALETKHAKFGEVVLKSLEVKAAAESWHVVNITPSKGSGYDEARVLLRNDSANKIVFQATWNIGDKAYDEAGNEINLVGGYIVPANSGWITIVFTKNFTWSELDLVLFDESNQPIAGDIDFTVASITFIYRAPEVEAMIDALDGTDAAAIAKARAAYEALSADSKTKVANLDKLIGYEADIWKAGMAGLPTSAEDVTAYDGIIYGKINAMLASYEQLGVDVQTKLTAEKALLDSLKTKFMSFQEDIVNNFKQQIAALPTVEEIVKYDADLEKKFSLTRAEYNALPDETKLLVADEEAILSALETKLATFGEVVLKHGDIVDSGKDWYTVAIAPTKTTGYEEAHVKLCNNGSSAVVFQVNWNVAVKAYDAEGNEIAVDPNGVIAANSGWITLVFTQTDIQWTEFNVAHYDGGATVGDINVTVESVTFVYEKEPAKVYDFTSNISQVSAVTVENNPTEKVIATYSESEQALAIDFNDFATSTWARVDLTNASSSETTEVHVFVKNDTNARIALQLNWTAYSGVADGDESKVGFIWGNTTYIQPNSGWVEIVYPVGAATVNQFNIALVDEVTSGSLYIGKITVE